MCMRVPAQLHVHVCISLRVTGFALCDIKGYAGCKYLGYLITTVLIKKQKTILTDARKNKMLLSFF